MNRKQTPKMAQTNGMRRLMREALGKRASKPLARIILCMEANYEKRKAMVDAGMLDDAYFPRSTNHEA